MKSVPKLSDYFQPTDKQRLLLAQVGSGNHVFYGGARGGGKLSPLYTDVCTPFGFRKMGDLKVGDIISNPNGSPQKVIQIFPHYNVDIYELEFEDGAKLEVGLDHLWLIRKTSSHKTKVKDTECENDEFGSGEVMDTKSIIEWLDRKEAAGDDKMIKKQQLCIPLCNPIQFAKSYKYDMRTIHPYILGVMIGDGCMRSTTNNCFRYTGIDEEIAENIRTIGYEVTTYGKENSIKYPNALIEAKRLGINDCIANNKFIPNHYKLGTIEQRIQLVQGLMDTDGYVDDRGHMSYTTVSEQLALDFQFVIRSLGGKAKICRDEAGYKKDGVYIQCQDAYTVWFNTKINKQLVNISRKRDRCIDDFNGGQSELQRRIVGYRYIGKTDARCITVSNPNRLYMGNDFIVTHNSHGARACAVRAAKAFPGIKIVVIRATYSELEEVFIQPIQAEYPPGIFKYRYTQKHKIAQFQNGSRILFRACENERDARKIQGTEYQLMIIDEAPLLRANMISRLAGSLRRNVDKLPTFIPTLIMTGNPGGISDIYFKTRYIRPDYSIWEDAELQMKDKRVFISAFAHDNHHLGAEYTEYLSSIEDPVLREAWLNGNWDVWDGQFFTEWNSRYHVIQPFSIPNSWRRFAGLDLGYTKKHPTVYLEFAEDPENGTIYCIKEYSGYGATEQLIRELKDLNDDGTEQSVIYADPSMFSSSKKDTLDSISPAMMFMSEGFPMLPANNDRVNGWRNFKAWLHMDDTHRPGLMIFSTCNGLISTIPTQRFCSRTGVMAEDLDTKGDDDFVDAARYALNSCGKRPKVIYESDVSEVNLLQSKIDARDEINNELYNTGASYRNFLNEYPLSSMYS